MATQEQTPAAGLTPLTQEQQRLVDLIRGKAQEVGWLMERLRERGAAVDQRWVSIAQTSLQQGFMAAVRSVAQPSGF